MMSNLNTCLGTWIARMRLSHILMRVLGRTVLVVSKFSKLLTGNRGGSILYGRVGFRGW